jgi:uncharacterized protein (DUF1697 family)
MRYVAFMRGINVGTAKRVAMADLRALAEELGLTEVATVLNSGNLIFDSKVRDANKLAVSLRAAIHAKCKVDCAVMVVSADTLKRVVAENPLKQQMKHPSRFLIAFARDDKAIATAKEMAQEKWLPDHLAVGTDAIYLWCEEGVLDSPLNKAFAKKMGESVTGRNWTTLEKVCAAL